jgi:hypothetical protein
MFPVRVQDSRRKKPYVLSCHQPLVIPCWYAPAQPAGILYPNGGKVDAPFEVQKPVRLVGSHRACTVEANH